MGSSVTQQVKEIVTRKDIVSGLQLLGVQEGMVLEVHASMKSLGYVIGGAQSVVDALIEAVGFDGTVVMPIQASENTEPSFWENPPVDRQLWKKIRENMPAFKPDESDIANMGAITENLNRRPGAYRSYHPSCAFVTYGRYGKLISQKQSLDFALSEESPLGQMYQMPSYVLLMGVDYDRCTAMHLAEYRSNARQVILQGGAVEENGYRKWVKYLDLALDSDEFVEIGQKMELNNMVREGKVGKSNCKLFRLADAVDFASEYLQKKYPM